MALREEEQAFLKPFSACPRGASSKELPFKLRLLTMSCKTARIECSMYREERTHGIVDISMCNFHVRHAIPELGALA